MKRRRLIGAPEREREALERRFLSGADCKWTPVNGSKALYVRRNGRAYRLSPTKARRWDLFRIQEVGDEGNRGHQTAPAGMQAKP